MDLSTVQVQTVRPGKIAGPYCSLGLFYQGRQAFLLWFMGEAITGKTLGYASPHGASAQGSAVGTAAGAGY
jgi:hypothetical protein